MATSVIAQYSRPDLAGDVRAGLLRPGQKELPSKYLYDEIGSALFEVISVLPEYGLTRADERLLRRHAADMVARLSRRSWSRNLAAAAAGKRAGCWKRWHAASAPRTAPSKFRPLRWHVAKASLARSTA